MRIFAIPVIFALAGCVVSPVFYQETLKSNASNDQATLILGKDGDVLVQTLDGKELANPLTTWNGGYAAVREIHLVPGTHVLKGRSGKGGLIDYFAISYVFEAAMRYKMSPKLEGYSLSTHIERADVEVKK